MVTPSSVCKGPRDISSSLAGHTLTSPEDSYLKNSLSSVLKTAPARLKLVDYSVAVYPPPFHSTFASYFMYPTRCII